MKQLRLADSFLDDDRELSLYDVVFPLVKLRKDRTPELLLGSCFPVGIGVYATAAHIFEPFTECRHRYKKLDPRESPLSLEEKMDRQQDMIDLRLFEGIDVNCGALILDQAAIREGVYRALGFSRVRHVVVYLDDDLAILFLHEDIRKNVKSSSLPIACLPLAEYPAMGEKIVVAGFPGKNNRIKREVVEGKPRFSVWLGLVTSDGEVTGIHTIKRDEGQCFYPCIETTACMGPGHSGGPAISKRNWAVVGVNSTGFEDGYSVVSWIGRALDSDFTLPFTLTLGGQAISMGEPVSLRRMAEAEVIQIIPPGLDGSKEEGQGK